jgi:hypothetical protein
MEKICPLMSKNITVNRTGIPDILTPEFQWVYCMKEQCALWKQFIVGQEEQSRCGLLAEY